MYSCTASVGTKKPYCGMDIFSTIAMLREILKEVRAFNKKVSDIEKKLQDLEEAECSGKVKRKKIAPSPEVRVSCHSAEKFLVTFELSLETLQGIH